MGQPRLARLDRLQRGYHRTVGRRQLRPKIVGSIVEQHFIGAGLSPGQLGSEKAYWRSIGLLLQNLGGFFGMLALANIAQVYGRRIAIALGLFLSIVSTWIVFRYMREFQDMY